MKVVRGPRGWGSLEKAWRPRIASVLTTVALTATSLAAPAHPEASAEIVETQSAPFAVDTHVVLLNARPDDVVIDQGRGLAYVSSRQTNEIISVSLSTFKVVKRRSFPNPVGMDISSDGNYLYVALNGSKGITRVDLSNWSKSNVVLDELGDELTWDVIEIDSGVVLVSADTSGFAWIVKYDFATDTEIVAASGRIIRGGPRFAIDDGDYAYIGEGFSPNSLYRLDLSTPAADIVAENEHGSVSGTQTLAVSPDENFVITRNGEKLAAATLLHKGKFPAGAPLINDTGSRVFTLSQPLDAPVLIKVSDFGTTDFIEEWQPDCGTTSDIWGHNAEFVRAPGSPDLFATTEDSLCIIHGDTAKPPPPPPPPPAPGGGRFFDDDTSIFQNDIEAIAAEGITKGCNPPYQTGYCPGDFVTRGQMAAFLVRAMGYTDNGGGDIFNDDNGNTFENDIDRLATAGVTKGCNPPTNTKYCPNDFVTRGQMAAFLARALDLSRTSISPRPETANGFDLDVIAAADMRGCTGDDGEVCTISDSPTGEFFLLTGWFVEDWSSLSSSEKSDFRSDRMRLEADFDGVPIELVELPVEVINDIAFKTYTFQFPSWLDGSHILELRYIDETESYLWTLVDNLFTSGSGYPLAAGETSFTTSGSSRAAEGPPDPAGYLPKAP